MGRPIGATSSVFETSRAFVPPCARPLFTGRVAALGPVTRSGSARSSRNPSCYRLRLCAMEMPNEKREIFRAGDSGRGLFCLTGRHQWRQIGHPPAGPAEAP